MKWIAMARFAVVLGWWMSGPAHAGALDLNAVLARAERSNPSLVSRLAMVEAARARIGPAGAWASPMIEMGLTNVPASGRLNEDMMTMKMVGLAQRVPVFGANGLSRRAAREGHAAERAGAEALRFQVLGEVFERFAEATAAQDRARESGLHRGVMERMVRSARSRYDSGNGRLEDVLRAEAERARATGELASFVAQARAARLRLAAALGESSLEDSLLALPRMEVAGLASWLEAVGPAHPRLAEAEARTRSYRSEARAARRMVWPELELRGAYGFRETLADGMPQDDMFSVSVGFMAPIFAGARELSEAAGMDAMARAADADRRGAELELRAGTEAAWGLAEAARRNVGLLADTVMAMRRRSVEAAWAGYGAGQADLLSVLESSHAYYAEELALVSARQELARALARLVALTGRADLVGVALPTETRREP